MEYFRIGDKVKIVWGRSEHHGEVGFVCDYFRHPVAGYLYQIKTPSGSLGAFLPKELVKF